ncbi:anti-repressor SinI family protein [Ectobacillus sp. sgz5001026]
MLDLYSPLISINEEKNLDNEWAELILYALTMGISSEEIRAFLRGNATTN